MAMENDLSFISLLNKKLWKMTLSAAADISTGYMYSVKSTNMGGMILLYD